MLAPLPQPCNPPPHAVTKGHKEIKEWLLGMVFFETTNRSWHFLLRYVIFLSFMNTPNGAL